MIYAIAEKHAGFAFACEMFIAKQEGRTSDLLAMLKKLKSIHASK